MALEIITSKAFRGLANLSGRRRGTSVNNGDSDLFRILKELQGLNISVAAGAGANTNIPIQAGHLAVPTGVVINGQTGGGTDPAGIGVLVPGTTYGYRVTAVDAAGGETTASTEVTAVLATGLNQNFITWTPVTGANGYNIYGRTSGGELKLNTALLHLTNFLDSGTLTPAGALPGSNTSFVSEIDTNDTLISVVLFTSGVPSDITATCSITSEGNIQCTNSTSGNTLLIHWYDKFNPFGGAFE